jgi:tRNA (guanine-N7-)-methyltransferase
VIYRPHSYFEVLDLRKLFSSDQPLEVELGSGDGSFLIGYAQQFPELNLLGVERLLGRLRKIERKELRAGLQNLRLLRIEAAYCLEYLLPPNCAQALHIYFPDPWPKRKHRKHRLINARFPLLAERVLRAGGTIYLRTDDADYFDQIQNVFNASGLFQPVPTPEFLSSRLTDFERDFLARGVATLRAAYKLCSR